MKKLICILVLSALTACNSQKEEKQQPTRHEADHHKHQDGKHGEANEYMHQASTQELIKQFESRERDAYQKPEDVLEFLGDINGKTVMDIGAGSGYFSVKLAQRGARVIAADVDTEFQAFIDKRIAEQGLSGIETRKIPFDSPGLQEEEADMVLIVNTYHHIEDRANYFPKVKMGTKETGELVIIDFFKSETPVGPPVHHKISIDQVISELKEAGYTDFEVNVNLLPYQYIIRAR